MEAARQNSSGIPIYLSIAASLRREIMDGDWEVGEKLPAITDIAKRFGVAPLTARQAVKHLEGLGILACKRGAGTFVAGPLIKLQSICLRPDLLQFVDKVDLGNLTNLPLPSTHALPDIPAGLKSAKGYQQFYRLFRIDNQPAIVSSTFVDRELCELMPKEFRNEPALPLTIKLSGGQLRRAFSLLTIDAPDTSVAGHLQLPPMALVAKLRLVLKDKNDIARYIGTLMFPAELVRVEFDAE